MTVLSRRRFMAFAAGGTVALAAGQVHAHDNQVRTYPAGAQSGGRDPGPHDPIREAEIRIWLIRPPLTAAPCPICITVSAMHTSAKAAAAGHDR